MNQASQQGRTKTRTDLSNHDQDLLQRLGQNWRLTPATLAYKLTRGKWLPVPWVLYVSTIIAQAISKGGGRIIISAPPRHGKSTLIDIWTPIWILEVFKVYNVILTSYGADLSEGFGREVRDLIIDHEADLTIRVRKDKSRVDDFLITDGGGMMSRGLGGAITGRGANVLLVDDYIKEIKEALSQVYRDYIWNWFVTTAYTRLEPGGSVIIIATRWHSDDLIGRVLKAFPGQWTNIVLPAIAEQNDPLGRPRGTALFPERYPVDVLVERLETLGPTFFQALFQQRPIDESRRLADGAWLKIIDLAPQTRMTFCRVWDLAATEDGGDYTASALCGYDKMTGFFYVLHMTRAQLSPKEVEEEVIKWAINDGPAIPVVLPKEPGAAGLLLLQHYRSQVLPEYKIDEESQTKNKVLRAQPLLAGAQYGKVFLLRAPWNRAFIEEFDTFPGAYDDQVDVVAVGYSRLTGKKVFSTTWGREPSSTISQPGKMDAIESGKKQRAAQFSLARSAVSWGSRRDREDQKRPLAAIPPKDKY